MKIIPAIVLLLLITIDANAAPRHKAHHPKRPSHPVLMTNLHPSIYWWRDDPKGEVSMPLHYHCHVKPLTLTIRPDHPNGTKIDVFFKDTIVNLGNVGKKNLDGAMGAFDEFGGLKSGYYIQAGEYDFDHDGIPEIVVVIGDGIMDMQVTVFKFHPPAYPIDAIRDENWEQVGSFDGQKTAWIEGATIVLPFGSQGLQAEYTWVRGKFVETDDLHH